MVSAKPWVSAHHMVASVVCSIVSSIAHYLSLRGTINTCRVRSHGNGRHQECEHTTPSRFFLPSLPCLLLSCTRRSLSRYARCRMPRIPNFDDQVARKIAGPIELYGADERGALVDHEYLRAIAFACCSLNPLLVQAGLVLSRRISASPKRLRRPRESLS